MTFNMGNKNIDAPQNSPNRFYFVDIVSTSNLIERQIESVQHMGDLEWTQFLAKRGEVYDVRKYNCDEVMMLWLHFFTL